MKGNPMSNEEYLDFLRASLKSNPLVDSEGYINPDYLISCCPTTERVKAYPCVPNGANHTLSEIAVGYRLPKAVL